MRVSQAITDILDWHENTGANLLSGIKENKETR